MFKPAWFDKKHTLVSGVDLGIRGDPTAIVTALVVPGRAPGRVSLVSVRVGAWAMAEVRQMTAGTVVGCDMNGEMIGGHTLRMHRASYKMEDLALHVSFGLWSFPTHRDSEVQQLIDDAMAWTHPRPPTKRLMAWWICDALIKERGLADDPGDGPC